MENQEKQVDKKLAMINLNKPALASGVGVFFAICKTAINNTNWARHDFDAVRLVEGQLKYLERFCAQEFKGVPMPPVPEVAPVPATPPTPEPSKPVEPEKAPEPKPEPQEEIIDLTDKGEKRRVPMPDSILEKVMDGVEASRAFIENPPKDPVKEAPIESQEKYEQVF